MNDLLARLHDASARQRSFVADAGHELRTPLTSIKAFVENLIEEDLADKDESLRFLEIVRKHADEFGYTFPLLLDPKLTLARVAGATIVPQVAVANWVCRRPMRRSAQSST